MKRKVLLGLVIGVMLFACYAPPDFELDSPFDLNFRQTKVNSDENIRIRFDGVVRDERCPIENNCLLPGNAQAALTFRNGSQRESFVLNTYDEPRSKVVLGYLIELTALAPPNSVDNPPGPADYVATVVVRRPGLQCQDNTDCAVLSSIADPYCNKKDGLCESSGMCEAKPLGCPDNVDPVCGCDGETYTNACEAAMNGVNVAFEGSCEPAYCWLNEHCAEDEYCYFNVCALETGVCRQRPEACDTKYDPVCGCDKKTYANSCSAAAAGVSVDYTGECRDTHCDDGTIPQCEELKVYCADHEIIAHQNNCYVCVNPATCKPWGEPNCIEDKDCTYGQYCNPCGTSSCPACDDCVTACTLR